MKKSKKSIERIFAQNFARNYERNNTWNIRRLVDETIVLVTQRQLASVLHVLKIVRLAGLAKIFAIGIQKKQNFHLVSVVCVEDEITISCFAKIRGFPQNTLDQGGENNIGAIMFWEVGWQCAHGFDANMVCIRCTVVLYNHA